MNILLLGSGGREHALAWKISASPHCSRLFIAPGNPGMDAHGIRVPLNTGNHEEVAAFCRQEKIGLVVVGPEQPLVNGLADDLIAQGFRVFGPRRAAAMLEGSKAYAKAVMQEGGVPTAAYRSFTSNQFEEARAYCTSGAPLPIVLKLDGLAAGKGVYICATREEAVQHLNEAAGDPSLAAAAASVVIEEFMEGEEVSVFAVTDGSSVVYLSPAQDHKRIGDNDTGPNTGGMGAYAPAPVFTPELADVTARTIVEPVLDVMRRRGTPYVGVLYCGLMITATGPKVVEFNCRFGDPECEVLMPLIASDLVAMMLHAVSGTLDAYELVLEPGAACTVVAAAEGYPAAPVKGDELTITEPLPEKTLLFHSGTAVSGSRLVTAGGRVMNCAGVGATLEEAVNRAYAALEHVQFRGRYARTDIGRRGLEHERRGR